MKLVAKYKKFLKEFDDKKQLRALYIVLGLIVVIGGFFLYRYSRSISSLKKKMTVVNKARKETQVLLSTNKNVEMQRSKVESMLEKEGKNFKLLDFFNNTLSNLKLVPYRTGKEKISYSNPQGIRASKYQEVNLNVQMTNLNMRQVTDLLYELEQSKRVYIKKLEITSSKTNPVVDLSLVIGTLQKKVEAEGN